jgi:bifunctional non-homologous end joining protein LigD
VQKHREGAVHYDLRLQVGSTLWSWVLAKGPSLDPNVRRVAVEEGEQDSSSLDALEGVIPAGEPGEGTVLLWDGGALHAAADGVRDADALRAGYAAGRLDFVLDGQRLRGAFSLVRSRAAKDGRARWHLVKQDDAFARPGSEIVVEETTSVASGLTIEEIARSTSDAGAAAPAKRKRGAGATRHSLDPLTLEPMYASIGTDVPGRDGWTFEPKYDGVRVLAHVSRRAVQLVTRNLKDKSGSFPEVIAALRRLAAKSGRALILDGEIVALEKDGAPARFQALQARMHVKGAADVAWHVEQTPAALIAFDLLRDGDDVLIDEPWTERRRRLEQRLKGLGAPRSSGGRAARRIGAGSGELRLGESHRGDGAAFLEEARRAGWEGVIAKRTNAPYHPGRRSGDWLKLKVEFRQEFVVGGWTEPRNSREHIGALLLGYWSGEEFVYAGHTGGGFTRAGLEQMYRKLAPLERKSSPFTETPRTNEKAHWAKPKVVVEVKFAEWTADGKLRQPIYLGTRDDKDAREVTLERRSVQRRKLVGRNGRGSA